MAMAGVAMFCLLTMPTISMDAAYRMTPEQMAESFPESEETEIDIKSVIGEEGIDLQLKLEITPELLFAAVNGDPNVVIEENFIEPNVANIVPLLKKPFEIIGKELIKVTFRVYYSGVFNAQIDAVKPEEDTRTTEEIAEAGGLTVNYIDSLSETTFQALNNDGSTLTSVNEVIFTSIKEGDQKFNDAGTGLTLPIPEDSSKDDYKEATKGILSSVNMVKEDGESIYPVSIVMNAMLVDFFRAANEQEAPEGETIEQKAQQLDTIIHDFIKNMLPSESYEAIAMVLKVLLVVIFIFVATWAVFFLYTFFRTILAREKVWTFTGPIFWILGIIQIVLGVALTGIVGTMMSGKGLSMMMGGDETSEAILSGLKVSIKTCTFIPSIILLILIPLLIVYAVVKHKYKKQLKAAHQAAMIPPAQITVSNPNDYDKYRS